MVLELRGIPVRADIGVIGSEDCQNRRIFLDVAMHVVRQRHMAEKRPAAFTQERNMVGRKATICLCDDRCQRVGIDKPIDFLGPVLGEMRGQVHGRTFRQRFGAADMTMKTGSMQQ